MAPELIRYFVLDGVPKKVDTPAQAEKLMAGGWAEIDILTYQTIVNDIELTRLAAIEAKREADRKAAEQAAQDAAAQHPPDSNIADEIAGMKTKTLEERVARLEAIFVGMGWPL